MTGVAITRVTLKKLNEAFIALPPFNEQQRIVDKLNSLMTISDALKAKIAKQQQGTIQVAATLINNIFDNITAKGTNGEPCIGSII